MLISLVAGGALLGDLLKTGGGAVGGFILGVLAEPVKGWINTRIEIRDAEKLLIEEINLLSEQAIHLLPVREYPETFKWNEPFGEFKFRLDRYTHLKSVSE
jgi:hypothetical protein